MTRLLLPLFLGLLALGLALAILPDPAMAHSSMAPAPALITATQAVSIYTYTLPSGHIFTIEARVSFGQAFIAGSLLTLAALLVLSLALRVVYGP